MLNAFGVRDRMGVAVGSPGDPLEREADEVAAQVMRGAPLPVIHKAGYAVQRKCTSCGAQILDVSRLPGAGQPLPSSTRSYFEPRFGRDLSGVRVHGYPAATGSSRQIGARAFTFGHDIAFGAGEFAPETAAGKRLLAHELTHVVQQSGGQPRVQADGELTDEDIAAIVEFLEAGSTTSAPQEQGGQDYSAFCPSCHQRPSEIREERRRLEAERLEKERLRKREEAWPGMHHAQHEGELAEQAKTLSEDIDNSKMALAQMRLQLFDRALANKTGAGKTPVDSQLTQEMRERWAGAEQATIVLESLFAATADELTAEVADSVRGPYRDFYGSLHQLFRTRDGQQKRAERLQEQLRGGTGCPTMACHQPAPAPRPQFSAFAQPQLPPQIQPGPKGLDFGVLAEFIDSLDGWRSGRLAESEGRNEVAVTRAAWKDVIKDFRWAVTILDEQLRTELWSDEGARGSLEQFEYAQELLARQQRFLELHPDAMKVQAIFYPKNEFTEKTDDKGAKTEAAKGLPWQFYMTRTPWEDPYTVPAGYEWQLHDITAPRRPNDDRTVRKQHQVTMIEALARERMDPRPIMEVDPPRTLYQELNHKYFFPEGELYWVSPITGIKDHITTTASWTFDDWLKAIGMTVAILGSLAFPPLSAAMVAAVLVGTGLSIAGSIHRLDEQEEHGVLTQADVDRFYWDVALDLASMATLGLGKIAVAARAASALRLAAGATRAFMIMKRVNIFLDVVNLGVVTHDFVAQYRAIQNSNMSEEQRNAALAKLAMFSMLAGALIIVPLRSSLKELRASGGGLHLDVDPNNPGRLVADLDPAAEAAGHLATRSTDKARIVDRTKFKHPDTGEVHSFALWSDGRITRCSEPPCLQMAESVLTRLDELRQRMPPKSPNLGGLQALAERVKQLSDQAEAVAAGDKRGLVAGRERVLAEARDIEAGIVALELKVAKETGWTGRVGSALASKSTGGEAAGRVTGAELKSGRTQAPLDWPIVRIDPRKRAEPVPDGVVLEFPNGARVWRSTHEDRGTVIESVLGAGASRQRTEDQYYTRGEMGGAYAKSDLERAHALGASLGESPYAITYAPREVNQELQNLGIEEFLRSLVPNPSPGVAFRIVINARKHPGSLRLSLIDYTVVAVQGDRATTLFSTGIRVEGTREAPRVSIAEDLTSVHPDAEMMLSFGDLSHTMLQRRLDMFARKAGARVTTTKKP